MVDKLDPKNSKCWTCKHGICIRQTEHEIIRNKPRIVQEEIPEYFDQPEELELQEVEHNLAKEGVYALCYWRPDGIDPKVVTSIEVQFVSECNRYEHDE